MKTTYDLADAVDKQAIADELNMIAFYPDSVLSLICKYRSDRGFFDDDGEYVRDTIGHTFTAEMGFVDYNSITDEMYLDDRNGDLRLQIAAVLEFRAGETMKVAAAMRKHYTDEVRGAP